MRLEDIKEWRRLTSDEENVNNINLKEPKVYNSISAFTNANTSLFGEDETSKALKEAETRFASIKKDSEDKKYGSERDTLTKYYLDYQAYVDSDVKNNNMSDYYVDKFTLDLINRELKSTANVGTYLQDTGAEVARNAKLATADALRNVAKASANLTTWSDGFNADTLYQIASAEPGTDISKIGNQSMTGSYAKQQYDKLKELHEKYPNDEYVAYAYELVTKKGYKQDKDYFKNTVPYLNQKLKEDRYNSSTLVKNTEDEIRDMELLKNREALSDYSEPANWGLRGVGVASYMIPSVGAGIITAGTAEGLAGAGAISATQAGINAAAQAGSLGSMYMSSAGRAFDDAIKQGYDWDKASLYSQLMGGLEVTTELIGGENVMSFLSGKMGGTALSKVTQELVKKGGNTASRFLIAMAADIGSEIVEEEISAFVEPIIDKTVLGKDITVEEYLKGALEAATETVLPTLIMGGLGKARIANSVTKTQTRLNAKIDALVSSNVLTKEKATELKEIVSGWTNDVIDGVYEREEEIKNELGTINYQQTYDEAMQNINTELNKMLTGSNIVKNPEYASTQEIKDLGTKVDVKYKDLKAIESDIKYLKEQNASIKSITPATTINKAQQTIKTFIEKLTGKQAVFVNIENAPNEFDYGFTNKDGSNLYLNANLDVPDTIAAAFHEAGHHWAKEYADLFKKFKSKVSTEKLSSVKDRAEFKGLKKEGVLEELFGNYLGSILTNVKTTKKLEKSTQSLVDNIKDMFSFVSKSDNSKVSQYNVDFLNYLGDKIINDKAFEKEILNTLTSNAKQTEVKKEPIKRLEKPARKEEKKSDGNTEKKVAKPTERVNEDKKAEPKKEQAKEDAKVEKNASKEKTKGKDASKEPAKKLNTLRTQLVNNMVKQLSEMEITPHNIEEVVAEQLEAATEKQLEKLFNQYNLSQRTLNRLQGKMYNEVEKALKKSSKRDIKYSKRGQTLHVDLDRNGDLVYRGINLPNFTFGYEHMGKRLVSHVQDELDRWHSDDKPGIYFHYLTTALYKFEKTTEGIAILQGYVGDRNYFAKVVGEQYGLKERESLELVNTLISRIRDDRNGGNRLDNGNINNKVRVQGATGTKEQVRGQQRRSDEGRSEGDSSKNSIVYSRTINDGSFSLPKTDNEGRELSEGQQGWNEGNKVIDSKGRLKHLYHGTNNGEFYIFDEELANVEGDWGAGFYLTDNEMDVNENYYGGGPDFEGKVGRLADHIYDQSDTDMSYSVAKERAREILEKGEYRIDAYGKMLNPAIVGETRLFDYSPDDVDVYREDYSSDSDYEEAIIDAIYDKVDEAIDEAALYVDNHIDNVDFGDYKTVKSAISQVIAENVIEPGSGIEMQNFKNELVDKLIDAGKYDNDGEWQSYVNEIVRLIIESQGYDGIIDPTVSKKFKNMNLDSGTTHYIFFKPNQIKDVDNLNPTDNPDIRYSRAQSKPTKDILNYIQMTENEDKTETFVDNTFVRIMRRVNREIFNNAEALVQFDNKVAKAMGKKIADVPTFLKLFDNWRRAGNADSIIAQIGRGVYHDKSGKQLTKGLANILGDLMPSRKEARAMGMSRNEAMQYRIEQLIALGTAERTIELYERDIQSGIDIDLAREVVSEYEDDNELHNALDEIRNDGNALIDYLVEKHVLQEETANYIKENNLLYFPFNRVLGEDTTKYGLGKKDGAVGRAIVGIKGSNLMLENPLVSIVGNWARMLQVIDQQTMVEKMKEAGKYLGEQEGLYFQDTKPLVKYQGEVGMDVFKGNIARQLEDLGYDDVVDRLDWNSLYQLFVPEKANPDKLTISYFGEDGKRRYIKFTDNDYGRPLYDIISNLNPVQSNKFLDFVNLLSQGVRLGATTMNWEFALGNMMSDSAQAYLYSEGFVVPLISSIFDIFKLGVGRGYVPSFRKDYKNYYDMFKRSGASLSGQFRGNSKYIRGRSKDVFGFEEDQLFNPNEKDIRKSLRKKVSTAGNTLSKILQFLPEYSEEATRFAEFVRVYDKLRNKGWSQEDAVKEAGIKAREITQDFSIQGNTMKSVNKIIPFSSATMGGLYRFGRELKTHPVRLTSRLTIMAAFALLMLETFRDDDDRKWYEEMNKQKKFDNYVINNGTNEPWIIKKPQGPARYFVNFVELIYNIANGYVEEDKIDEAVKDWAEMSAKDQLPIYNASDFVPGGLQAFLENELNQDFYYGSKIVPQSLENLDPRHQYDENTSEFAKAVGDAFNWSPLKIDNVVKSSFAGLGKLFLSATDEAAAMFGANEKPSKKKGERYIIDKFYANALKNPESVNYVYDRLDELENEKAEGRMTAKEQREYEKLTVAKSTLADINKQIREIKGNDKLSGEKKTTKIEDLQEMKVDVARYYQGKPLIEKGNKTKIELMEYYPSQDTYVYTVNKDNKVNLDFSSNALKTEYAKMFKQKYDELLKELKASSEYQQATATTKVTLEKETKTKARTATTNDMKKIVYERTKG